MAIGWFTKLFTPQYRLPSPCPACAARMAHIEDLQNLLKSERESYAALQEILLTRTGFAPVVSQGDLSPIGGVKSVAQRRQAALDNEKNLAPNAKQDYWKRVQEEYDKAGKLPKPDENA